MKKLLPLAAAAIALLGAAPGASAVTQFGDHLTLSGFGTLGAMQTNSDEGRFAKDRQPGGGDKSASLNVDSNFGLQLTGTATSWLSATVQVLDATRADKHASPRPAVEWAFITVKPLDGLTLRGGRINAPVFLISDSRNIGYANNWLRAPNEVYALNVFNNLNGGDVTYRQTFGPVSVSLTGVAGASSFSGAQGLIHSRVEQVRGLNLLLETDWATVRLGRTNANVISPFNPDADPYSFTGIGVVVDRDNIVAQAEYVKRTSKLLSDAVNSTGWYVMAGYRLGKVLPYTIFSGTRPKTPDFPSHFSYTQRTTAFGIRWDALRSIDFKLQVERLHTDNTPGISFNTPSTPPSFPGGPAGVSPVTKPVTALSLAMDFTF